MSAVTHALRLVLAAALLAVPACGGGSPSDVVLPDEVDVTLAALDESVPRSVELGLASAEGAEVGIQVLARELETSTGVAFELNYDPTFLEFRSAGPGTYFGATSVQGADVVETQPGVLVGVSANEDQGATRNGSGTLLTLQFRLRQLRDAETDLVFGFPESQVYGVSGVAGQHSFSSARLVTRIRAPR